MVKNIKIANMNFEEYNGAKSVIHFIHLGSNWKVVGNVRFETQDRGSGPLASAISKCLVAHGKCYCYPTSWVGNMQSSNCF